jgi:hypothetical protein
LTRVDRQGAQICLETYPIRGSVTVSHALSTIRPRLAGLLLVIAVLGGIAAGTQAGVSSLGFAAARLKYGGGGDWYSNPSSLPNLLRAVRDRTSIPVQGEDEVKVSLGDDTLFNYPLIYMNGHGEIKFTEAELEMLRRYLEGGGFLWADDNYGMDKSFRREMRRLYPESPLVELPFDHPIYHSFYHLPAGLPKIHEHDGKPAQGLGLFRNGRLVAFYSYESDIGDGLEDAEVHGDTSDVRELAMRMAVNVVVYVMTN